MPKTAVHEYGYFSLWPGKIRLSSYWPLLAVAPKPRCPKQFSERDFGGGVAARPDCGHDLGPDFLRYVVHMETKLRLAIGVILDFAGNGFRRHEAVVPFLDDFDLVVLQCEFE